MAASVTMGLCIALMPTTAFAQHAASNVPTGERIRSPQEREIFTQLKCMCGGCAREPLSECVCGPSDQYREAIRQKLAAGETKDQIILEYVKENGSESLAYPQTSLIYAAPLVANIGGGVGLAVMVRRWKAKPKQAKVVDADARAAPGPGKDAYDARLDEELKDLDG